jgi:hypothetical protein
MVRADRTLTLTLRALKHLVVWTVSPPHKNKLKTQPKNPKKNNISSLD